MAKDILNAIIEIEKLASSKKLDAEQKAKIILKTAKENGENLIKLTEKEAYKKSHDIISDSEKQADVITGSEYSDFSEDEIKLIKNAEQRVSSAAEFIIKKLADM